MGIRDVFRGGRDEGRERWRDEGRYGREQSERQDWPRQGSERDFGGPGRDYGGAYGQSDWAGRDQDYGSAGGYGAGGQYSQDNPREPHAWESGGRNYTGGFYTGESGRERSGQRGSQQFGRQYASRSGGQYGRYGQAGEYGQSDQYGSGYGGMSSQMGEQSYEGPHRGRGPRGYQRSDDRIREDICESLTEDPSIDASNLEVTVKNCEVTLTGTVNSREDKRRAVDLAEDISGVKDVHNNLRISATDQSTGSQSSQATQTSRH